MNATKCTCRLTYSKAVGFHVRVGAPCAFCKAKAEAERKAREDEASRPQRELNAKREAIASLLAEMLPEKTRRADFILSGHCTMLDSTPLDEIRKQISQFLDSTNG